MYARERIYSPNSVRLVNNPLGTNYVAEAILQSRANWHELRKARDA